MTMRRLGGAAAVVLAAIGIALAVVPFERPQARGTFTYGTGVRTHCTSPVVQAWRRDDGWFGYAPLTNTPMSFTTCRGAVVQ